MHKLINKTKNLGKKTNKRNETKRPPLMEREEYICGKSVSFLIVFGERIQEIAEIKEFHLA